MSNPGSRVDWGESGKFMRQSRKMSGNGSFSSLLGSKKSKKNNNKETGYVSKGGGSAGQQKTAGLDNLHVTQVERPVNTARDKNNQVTKGGGTAPRKVVQGKVAGVKVQPEC